VDLYSASSSTHLYGLRWGTRSQAISQFYLHTPRSSANGTNHTVHTWLCLPSRSSCCKQILDGTVLHTAVVHMEQLAKRHGCKSTRETRPITRNCVRLVMRSHFRSYHTIRSTIHPMRHANFVTICFTELKFYIAGIRFTTFLLLWYWTYPMTIIYEPHPYSLEIYRTCEYELPTSRLSKLIVWQRHRHDRNYIPRRFACGRLRMPTTNATVCAQQEACWICSPEPLKSVNLLFDLKTLQVVELRLVRLECAVDFVFCTMRCRLALSNNQIRFLFTIRLTQIIHSPPWH